MTTTASELKARHRVIRETQPESRRIRIHRAISWLARAEREAEDADARFLFLWIAFNAAYASEFGFEQKERDQARQFIDKLLQVDTTGRLQAVLLDQFTGPIRTLIENRFVFEPFWKAIRDHDGSSRWEESFAASKRLALRAVMERQTGTVLSVVLDRLHVLRNQIVHGGATWNGAANREQVRDAARILGEVVPVVVELMMRADDVEFGGIAYPVIVT